MNRLSILRNSHGISLVEVMFYGAIASWIGLSVVHYMRVPMHLNSLMNTVSTEQNGYSATNLPIDDLKCALSASIQWTLIDQSQGNPPYDPAVNSLFIPWFQVNDPNIPTPGPQTSYVCYRYRPSDGALLREFISGGPPTASPTTECAPVLTDNAQETVLAKGLLPPTPAIPLFSKDQAASNIVVLMLRVSIASNKVVNVVRRVHIRS